MLDGKSSICKVIFFFFFPSFSLGKKEINQLNFSAYNLKVLHIHGKFYLKLVLIFFLKKKIIKNNE